MIPRSARVCWIFTILSMTVGCAGETLYPVTGKALVDGTPIPNGSLLFVPDAAKGNTGKAEPAGTIEKGKYTLYTNRKEGAPLGWYKVVVIAAEPINPQDPYTLGKSYIDGQYNSPATTNLNLEVTATPATDAYDLDLKKKSS